MDEASYALQDLGFSPNEAHRYSRAIALGRRTDLTLTPEQDSQLRARLTDIKKRREQPPRQLQSLWNVLNASHGPEKAFQQAATIIDNPGDAA